MLFVCLYWFVSAVSALEVESPVRLVIGGFFIFFLPGFIYGEVLRLRSTHVLQTLALSFVLSFIIEMILIPIPFFFTATIRLWVWLLIATCSIGLIVFYLRLNKAGGLVFTTPLFEMFSFRAASIRQFLMCIAIALVSSGAYKWGEDLVSIAGEKILHLVYVRYYFSMPMVLSDLAIVRGDPPPNLIYFWEYLLAGWAVLINTDPLLLFYRSRFVVPVLGFSGMYLLARSLFKDEKKVEVVFFGVLVMSLGALMTLDPSPLSHIKQEQFRYVMSFMGTSHHADSAMDVLLPVCTALLFMALRDPTRMNFIFLAGISCVSFLWHPREFFQTLIYAVVVSIALLIMPDENKRAYLKRWVIVMMVFIAVGAAFFIMMKAFVPSSSHGYDESLIKKLAIKNAFSSDNLLVVRNLFKFPHHLTLTSSDNPGYFNPEVLINTLKGSYHFMLWLIITAAIIPVLSIFGDKEDRRTVLLYILLWFLLLAWNFSMLIVIFLTYSEVFITTPRMLYLFSYILIADFFYVLAYACTNRRGNMVYILCAFLFGIGICLWWRGGIPFADKISVVLSFAILGSFIVILLGRGSKEKGKRLKILSAFLAIILFFTPILWKEYRRILQEVMTGARPQIDWFGEDNLLGLSKELIAVIRGLPTKSSILINPTGMSSISIYSPLYMSTLPRIFGTVISARKDYDEAVRGKNPVYNPEYNYHGQFVFNKKLAEFHESFNDWSGPENINMRDLSHAAKPIVLQLVGGEFDFKKYISGEGNVLRVYPTREWEKGSVDFINFVYESGQNGFDLTAEKGEYAVFEVSARVTNPENRLTTNIFIAEKDGNIDKDRKTVAIDSTLWKRYSIFKRIRGGNTINFGMLFFPSSIDDWLEIKDLKIIITDSFPRGTSPSALIDDEAIKKWLKMHKVRYLLVEDEFYNNLIDYFSGHKSDFKIIFNNQDRGELVIEFVGLDITS